MSDWIDISAPLRKGIPQWPGDPLFETFLVADISKGDDANVTAFSMCAHTGTHLDAPRHYFDGGVSVDEAPLEILNGPARVLTLDTDFIGMERVLFRTGNSQSAWWREPFRNDFDALTPQLAERLVAAGVKLVGIDYLSVGRNDEDGAAVHRILLGAGVWLLEGLDLCDVVCGDYDLTCLPLRLEGADGAPARALLRTR